MTPSSTALRSVSGLFRAGRQPRPFVLALLVLPIVAALVLALVLLRPWSGGGRSSGPTGGAVADSPNSPPPDVRAVKLGTPSPLSATVSQLSANPQGGGAIVADSGGLAVLDPASLTVLNRSKLAGYPYQVHLGPNGISYVVESGRVEVFGPGGVRFGEIPLPATAPATALATASTLSADGRTLVILVILVRAGDAVAVRVLDTVTDTVSQFPLPPGAVITGLEVSGDGGAAYLMRSLAGVWRIDLATGLVTDAPGALTASSLAVSVDGRVLFAASASLISTLDAGTGALIRRTAVPGVIGGMLPLRGRQLAVIDGTRHVLKVIDPGTGDVLATAPIPPDVVDDDHLATDGQRIFLRRVSTAEVMTVTEN